YTAESDESVIVTQRSPNSVIRGNHAVEISGTHDAAGDVTIELMAVGFLGGAQRTATLTLENGFEHTFFADTPASNDPLVYENESVTVPAATFNAWRENGTINGNLSFSNDVQSRFSGNLFEIRLRYPIQAANGVAGRTVHLDIDGNGTIDRSTTTFADDPSTPADEGGRFVFVDVPTGTHAVHFEGTEGWANTLAGDGSRQAIVVDGLSTPNIDFGGFISTLVGGEIIADTILDDTTQPYFLYSDTTIRNAAKLTVLPGVRVETLSPKNQLLVGTDAEVGELDVNGASLSSGSIQIASNGDAKVELSALRANGIMVDGNFAGSETTFRSDLATADGSTAELRFSDFLAPHTITLHPGATQRLYYNNFAQLANDSVIVSGDADANIDVSENWWGTTDAAAIAGKIVDNSDDSTRPTVLTDPPLTITPVLGDANGDGLLTNADIGPFIAALTNPNQYAADFPSVKPDISLDMNWSGTFTNADIAGFIAALTGGRTRGDSGDGFDKNFNSDAKTDNGKTTGDGNTGDRDDSSGMIGFNQSAPPVSGRDLSTESLSRRKSFTVRNEREQPKQTLSATMPLKPSVLKSTVPAAKPTTYYESTVSDSLLTTDDGASDQSKPLEQDVASAAVDQALLDGVV
ncbi:MAG: hypothetical protein AAGG44_06220, partial [Planctomycetota bacterium]